MKKGIHPDNYRPVVFKDMSNGDMLRRYVPYTFYMQDYRDSRI